MNKSSFLSQRNRAAAPNKQRRGGRRKRPNNRGPPTSEGGKLSGTSVTNSFIPIFPTKVIRWLRYCTDFSLSSSLGVMATHVFSASGLYDPDITSTGHQPLGFDEMMRHYEHYHVLVCRWKVVFRNTGNDGGFVGARVDADASPLSVYTDALENGRMASDILDKAGTTYSWKELQGVVDNVKVMGLTRANYLADGNSRGTVTSNPSEQTYLHFSMWNPFGTNCTCQGSITLEFLACFTEPRPLAPSLRRVPDEDKFEICAPPPLPPLQTTRRGAQQAR